MWFNFSSLCLQPKWVGATIRSFDIAPPQFLTVTEACNEKRLKKTETAKQSTFSLDLLSFFPFFPSPLFSFFPPSSSFSLSLPADFWCGDRRHAAPLPTGLIDHSYNWLIYIDNRVTSNWACSEQLVTSLKTRHICELRWECVFFLAGRTLH